MTEVSKQYNLEERTEKFGRMVIIFCKSIRPDAVSKPLISQLVRAGTSIGANYREANSASSKKDFRNKIFTCKKEAEETKYWLKMLKDYTNKEGELINLLQEVQELILIFGKILSTLNHSKLNRN
ncbi:MAG: four helix bundle protein [Candidatus Colwellbacteria bacterium]|nr:four helix bundle protein [Candidatus Colwellbacteria bacterium]